MRVLRRGLAAVLGGVGVLVCMLGLVLVSLAEDLVPTSHELIGL